MPRYADQHIETVIANLSTPENRSPKEVAQSEGISLGTVYKWRREAPEQGRCLPNADSGGAECWGARDKFSAVVEAVSLNEHELAEYCRRRDCEREQKVFDEDAMRVLFGEGQYRRR